MKTFNITNHYKKLGQISVALRIALAGLVLVTAVSVQAQSTQAAARITSNTQMSGSLHPDDWAQIIALLPGASMRQEAYLKSSNPENEDYFGEAVAVSGDTIVAGSVYEDSNATGVNGDQANNSVYDAGAAYVFIRNLGTWSQQAYLKASNTGVSDYFGESVAISGDTVVVGARNEDSNATGVNGDESDNLASDSGAAYVFTRCEGTWSQQAYLKASNSEAGDYFAFSVKVFGDIIVVGAVNEDSNSIGVNGDESDNSASDSGAAYVFTRSGGAWSQQAYLKASNSEAGDKFGRSVPIFDGTVVVGAHGEEAMPLVWTGTKATIWHLVPGQPMFSCLTSRHLPMRVDPIQLMKGTP
jgi:hypothetical protein